MTLNAIIQERIGVHPRDWGVPLPVPLEEIDEGIRDIVVTLNAGGVETYQSCQGGPGHAYFEPTVQFHGSAIEGFRALAWAVENGLSPNELRRVWSYYGREIHGPMWEMTFARDAPDQ